jgi:hypothetical protein
MIASNHPEGFYSSTSHADRTIIDDWESKYPKLIQEYARRIVDQEMQLNANIIRASSPFLRLHVHAYSSDFDCGDDDYMSDHLKDVRNQGVLTVWNVTDYHLDILTEGTVVSAKNVSVKGSLHEGLLQLSASSWTSLELLSPQPGLERLKSYGFRPREYTPLLFYHLASVELFESSSVVYPEYDIIGYCLHVEQEGECIKIYLTDESGLVVRIDRAIDVNNPVTMSQVDSMKRNYDLGLHCILIFQNIRVMPYDFVVSYAIGLWTQSSSQLKLKNERHQSILSWVLSETGGKVCDNLRTLVKVRVPSSGIIVRNRSVAVGYITMIQSHHFDNNIWRFTVDCMGSTSIDVNFPSHLLDDLLRIYDEDNDSDIMSQFGEWKVFVQKLVTRKEILVQFVLLQGGGEEYFVHSIREADLLGLSRILITR